MAVTQFVSPFKCRMWDMHDRLGEEVTPASCASLIESIQKHGQKQPALARRRADGNGHEYELIYGARRLFAARHLGVQLLVELRQIDDRAALIEMDIENRVRMDISPYERGLSYRRWLRDGHFASQLEIARSLGVSEAQISRLLRYAELPAAVVAAFASPRDIREEWAIVLAKLCRDASVREALIRRARRCSALASRPGARQIFDALVNEGPQRIVAARPRDEVIRNANGAPVLRVRFRARAVHLIVQRDRITPATLRKLTDGVRGVLDAVPGSCRGAEAAQELVVDLPSQRVKRVEHPLVQPPGFE
jgi:ParB/RepB/Spo0J family partition protein